MGKCPFNKMKKCDPECELFRKGVRYFDDPGKDPKIVEVCAFTVIADALENQIMRTIGLQREMNVLRNNFEKSISGLIGLARFNKAMKHEIEHEVTKRLREPEGEIIEVKESDVEDGKAEV